MNYVFLTGATGLLGRYLIKDLTEAGFSLAVLVRPSRRKLPPSIGSKTSCAIGTAFWAARCRGPSFSKAIFRSPTWVWMRADTQLGRRELRHHAA